jgi:protoporphyrinogen/coproporphyrinogen III oxidase
MTRTRVVIVGGGIAGLSCAWFLTRTAAPDLGLDVRVLELGDRVGGKLRSERDDGVVYEWGPHGILDDAEDTRTLIRELELEERVVRARESMKQRWVLWNGKLHAVPTSPPALLSSSLLSLGAKLRVFKEPFVKAIDAYDESIADFAKRRFGGGVVEPLVEPGVAGIFAGDVAQLSLRSAFPKLHALEQEHGSVLKGFGKLAKERRARGEGAPTLLSFREGMGELPSALARSLGDRIQTRVKITSISRDGSGYALDVEGAQVPTMRADVLVLACASSEAKRLVTRLDPDLASNLGLIPTAPIAVVCLAFERGQVAHPLDGFGFLCARREQRAILGAIFASSVFEGHAPEGVVQLRALLGGALGKKHAALDDEEVTRVAKRELSEILGIRGEPRAARVFRHPLAIPQYVVGHHARLAAIDSQLNRHPQLYVAGASYRGVSVNDCVKSGRVVAGNLLRHRLSGG